MAQPAGQPWVINAHARLLAEEQHVVRGVQAAVRYAFVIEASRKGVSRVGVMSRLSAGGERPLTLIGLVAGLLA